MLTPNEPLRSMTGQVFEVVMTQKPTSGGSSDTEKKEPAAMPTGRPSSNDVTMVTPVGKLPRIWRNRAASSTTTTSSLMLTPWRSAPSVGEGEERRHQADRVPLRWPADLRQQVPELAALGAQVGPVIRRRFDDERNPLGDLEGVAGEAFGLGRVVRHEPDGLHTEIVEDLGADAVVPVVDGKALGHVRLDGVQAAVLEPVGLDLGRQANAPAFVSPEVHDGGAPGLGNVG